jgi:hypothetical protein
MTLILHITHFLRRYQRRKLPSKLNKKQKYGRKSALCNSWVRGILWVVGSSHESISSGEIAKAIRIHMDKKMSNEYKWIKKLCPPLADEDVSLLPMTAPEDNPCTKRYLNITFLEEDTQLSSDINKVKTDDSSKGKEDRRERGRRKNWRYSLSFRGLLLYIYNEYNEEGKSDKHRIHSVIQNPLVVKEAPFLKYSEEFEKHAFMLLVC